MKFWYEETPGTTEEKVKLMESIELRLEDSDLGEFEIEYGKKEATELEEALKKNLKRIKKLIGGE